MTELLEPDPQTLRSRSQWRYRGADRPEFAQIPGEGQESVWDYPRPPRVEPEGRRIEILFGVDRIAATTNALRVLETASPPTYYLPPADVRIERLVESGSRSFCEWKGLAFDLDLVGGPASVAWSYPKVFPEFAAIAGWYAFYAGRLDCFVDGERARSQPGGYYGGWITHEIIGPFKGETGCDGL